MLSCSSMLSYCYGLHLMPSYSSMLRCCYGLRLMPSYSSMLSCCCGLRLMLHCSSMLSYCCYGLRLMPSCSSLLRYCCGLRLMLHCSSMLSCCYGLRLMPSCSSMLSCCCGLHLMPSCSSMLSCCYGLRLMQHCFLIQHCCCGLRCLLTFRLQGFLYVMTLRQIRLQCVCSLLNQRSPCGSFLHVREHIRIRHLDLWRSSRNSWRSSNCGFLRACTFLCSSSRRGGDVHSRHPKGGKLRDRVHGYSVMHSSCEQSGCDSVHRCNYDSTWGHYSRSSCDHCSVHRYACPSCFLPYIKDGRSNHGW